MKSNESRPYNPLSLVQRWLKQARPRETYTKDFYYDGFGIYSRKFQYARLVNRGGNAALLVTNRKLIGIPSSYRQMIVSQAPADMPVIFAHTVFDWRDATAASLAHFQNLQEFDEQLRQTKWKDQEPILKQLEAYRKYFKIEQAEVPDLSDQTQQVQVFECQGRYFLGSGKEATSAYGRLRPQDKLINWIAEHYIELKK